MNNVKMKKHFDAIGKDCENFILAGKDKNDIVVSFRGTSQELNLIFKELISQFLERTRLAETYGLYRELMRMNLAFAEAEIESKMTTKEKKELEAESKFLRFMDKFTESILSDDDDDDEDDDDDNEEEDDD